MKLGGGLSEDSLESRDEDNLGTTDFESETNIGLHTAEFLKELADSDKDYVNTDVASATNSVIETTIVPLDPVNDNYTAVNEENILAGI